MICCVILKCGVASEDVDRDIACIMRGEDCGGQHACSAGSLLSQQAANDDQPR